MGIDTTLRALLQDLTTRTSETSRWERDETFLPGKRRRIRGGPRCVSRFHPPTIDIIALSQLTLDLYGVSCNFPSSTFAVFVA